MGLVEALACWQLSMSKRKPLGLAPNSKQESVDRQNRARRRPKASGAAASGEENTQACCADTCTSARTAAAVHTPTFLYCPLSCGGVCRNMYALGSFAEKIDGSAYHTAGFMFVHDEEARRQGAGGEQWLVQQ